MPEYLTVPELADLLRLKERKVYDLAAAGDVPCSRATGKLLFPADGVRAWIARASTGPVQAPRPNVLLGSHDPLLDWAVRASGCGLATFLDGSSDGLARFASGEGVAAGLHLFDAASGGWNRADVARALPGGEAVLIRVATRRRGLLSAADGPALSGLADLDGLRIAARQPQSGTARLFEHAVREAGLDPARITTGALAHTETEAAQAVARGTADATFGLEALARDFGLRFTPVIEERFDLLADRRAWFEPPLQALAAFCRTPAFAERAAELGGYDVTDFGAVVWNG